MNLKKLYEMQKALDFHIEMKHGLENQDLFDQKVLALLVEVGELANETRCFKFWSKKPSSPRETVLEEFVDGIHFILSLGIECGFTSEIEFMGESKGSITEQFNDVFRTISSFQKSRSESDYRNLFRSFMNLANLLGFATNDIEEAYRVKNEVNYERQQNGY
ncbi:dUTPase [Neobacillus piezotolerans]|uniref:dUTPase n=1 Tax=Neobacillus piezotolerans TaxID=2259171 RepID=A0A3D8GPN1_9BACI|nr:dUTP diphosphatase [Neobacillus piezotolerans]RDU36242.1 dUTPase [Neobacillus piezotolerans]